MISALVIDRSAGVGWHIPSDVARRRRKRFTRTPICHWHATNRYTVDVLGSSRVDGNSLHSKRMHREGLYLKVHRIASGNRERWIGAIWLRERPNHRISALDFK